MKIRWAIALVLGMSVAACGGNDTKEIDCGAAIQFQNRVEGPRVVAPEDLDSLNEMAEMPIPRADPNAPKHAPGVCNDVPPMINVSGG